MRLPKSRLFDYTTPGPGVPKDAPPKKGFALYWDILYRRFWKMVSLNVIYLLLSVPGLIIMWFLVYGLLTLTFSDLMLNDPTWPGTVTQLSTYLTCLIYSIFGGGAVTAGMTYVVRNYAVDTHSWVWTDFWAKYKENFKQGTAVFVVDLVMLTLLGINFWFYGMLAGENFIAYLLQGLMVVIFLIFLLMHAYIYPIMISFDKKVKDIYKDAFILAIGKLPITFASLLVCILIAGLVTYLACFVTVYAMLLIPVIMFVFVSYTNLFITYPVIKKYMVKQ